MRIGVLTTSYPRFDGDPAGLFVRGLARALAARGHALEVLAPEPHEPFEPPVDERVELRWVRYARPRWLARTFYGAGVPDNVRRDPRAWPGLLTYPAALHREARARVERWDAVLSHWALPCALVAGAVRAERPHLAVLHSADVHLMRRLPLRGRWADALGEGATQLVFSSGALRKEVLSWVAPVPRAELAGRCHVSAMGIEQPERARPRRAARKAAGAEGFVILSLGRLVPLKGVDVAIDAAAAIGSTTLWIAGEGPERRALERRAGQRRSPARFWGTVTGARKWELLAAADAFVVPSLAERSGRTEGVPTALLEAAAAGLPIVASAVGGIPEVLVHEKNALLVPPGDPSALAHALTRLREDSALRRKLGRAARELGRRYRWTELAPHFEELLRD
jgi:glycosyltransferase involved in cell wall biosynthesis